MGSTKASKKVSKKKIARKNAAKKSITTKHKYATREEGRAAVARGEI